MALSSNKNIVRYEISPWPNYMECQFRVRRGHFSTHIFMVFEVHIYQDLFIFYIMISKSGPLLLKNTLKIDYSSNSENNCT